MLRHSETISAPHHTVKSSNAVSDLGSRLLGAFDDQAICILTRSGTCVSASDHWYDLAGYMPEDIEGKGLLEKVHPTYQDKINHRLSSSDQADGKAASLRCQLQHQDGSPHWYDMRILAVEENGDLFYTCLFRHVTEQVQTHKKLHRALAQAELALKSRSEFLANMSHELRTPLNAILGFSQIMQNQLFGKIGNTRYRDYLANIQESGHALLSKINDLLEISHIDSGRVQLKSETLDATELMRSAMEIHTHHAFSKRVAIRENYTKSPIFITGDRVKLKQALSNLISNALAYNHAGGSVTLETARTNEGHITFSVTDTGKGISAKQIKEIHQALQQKESFFDHQLAGVGLGLALAKEFAGLHQGGIRLESNGHGCKAMLTLPKKCAAPAPSSARAKQSMAG